MVLIRREPEKPKTPPARRSPGEVLGFESGASRAGSTYWKRMRRCPREHALANIVRLRKKHPTGELFEVSWALGDGILFHLGLETYYKARLAGADTGAAEEAAWAKLGPLASEPGYAESWTEVERMLAGYFENYRHLDAGWKIVAVEETLEYDSQGLTYSARLDLVVEIEGGLWVVEHKTARAITEDLLTGYQLDMQIVGQVWLLKVCVDLKHYAPLRGVMVNITTKHVSGPRFERIQVCPSMDHLVAFEQSMRSWARLTTAFRAEDWPKALGNCTGGTRYFSACEYYDVCHNLPRETVQTLYEAAEPPYGFLRLTAEEAARADEADEAASTEDA